MGESVDFHNMSMVERTSRARLGLQYDKDIEAGAAYPADYTPTGWVRQVVGELYRGSGAMFRCIAYNPSHGFWMLPEDASSTDTLHDVSERAIGRTFHKQ